MNIYAYDCMGWDKGIIIADSYEEAVKEFKKLYKLFNVVDYRAKDCEAEIHFVNKVEKGLYVTVPF